MLKKDIFPLMAPETLSVHTTDCWGLPRLDNPQQEVVKVFCPVPTVIQSLFAVIKYSTPVKASAANPAE